MLAAAVVESFWLPKSTLAVELVSTSKSERPVHANIFLSAEPCSDEKAISGKRPLAIVAFHVTL